MTTPFFVLNPDVVIDADFVSSNVPENDFPVYSSEITYALGARVIVTTGVHRIYESLQETNLNHQPETSPTFWLEVGPTNRWAAFDSATGTITRQSNSVEFSVSGSEHQAIALLELKASHVQVRILVGGVEKFNTGMVKMQDRSVVLSYYDYLFSKIDLQTDYILDEIPVYRSATYEVKIVNAGAIAEVGNFLIGDRTIFGFTEYGAAIGIIDYSKKVQDVFGRTTIQERRFTRRMSVSLMMEKAVTDGVARKMAELRAKPALYVGARDDYESLTIYGFPRDWSVDITFPTMTSASFEIEGI
jgi:hypothetical protein